MKTTNYLICFGILCGLLCGLFTGTSAVSAEMVYTPINPNFGGNPLNGNYLLSTASAQNDFEEDKDTDLLGDFEEQLSRRILSDISRKLTQDSLGDDLQSGTYILGDFSIDIDTGGSDGIIVDIFDSSTGNSSTITVPRY